MRQDIAEKLVSFYRDDVEGYIRNAGRTFLKIHAGANFTGYQDIKIRIGDVARYYAHVGGLRGHIFTGCCPNQPFALRQAQGERGMLKSCDFSVHAELVEA